MIWALSRSFSSSSTQPERMCKGNDTCDSFNLDMVAEDSSSRKCSSPCGAPKETSPSASSPGALSSGSPRPASSPRFSSPRNTARESDSCAICGCDHEPAARSCQQCEWPRGVMAPLPLAARTKELSSRLQGLVGVAADMAQIGPSELESNFHIGPYSNALETCEDTVSALERMLPQARRRMRTLSQQNAGSCSPTQSIATSIATSAATSVMTDHWQDNTHDCAVCAAKLGKRRFNPRHHCRSCGKCVCSKCSPNRVSLDGVNMSRVCNLCVSTAFWSGRSGSPAPSIRGSPGGSPTPSAPGSPRLSFRFVDDR